MVFLKMNNLNVLYEDNHSIVVEKKPNILSQSDITGDKDFNDINIEKPEIMNTTGFLEKYYGEHF